MPTNRLATAALLSMAASTAAGPFLLAAQGSSIRELGRPVAAAPTMAEPTAPASPETVPTKVATEVSATSVSSPGQAPARSDIGEPAEPPSPPAERSFVETPVGEPRPDLGPHVCIDADPTSAFTEVLGSELPLAGADYQRAFALPDGRILWLFQDAFVDTPTGRRLVHNVALLQSGSCFQLLHGGDAVAPAPYLFADVTEQHRRWFWPLGGDIGADGLLYVFVAEMHEHSGRYLGHVEPVATWLVSIDPGTLEVVERTLAADSGADLYGWSVVAHREHTYLYAHCYRQFGWDPFPFAESTVGTHDWDCTADVTVARVPRGRFDIEPEYWNGAQWTNDAGAAVAVIPTEGRSVNPTQVAVLDDRFVAVTKVDDWWGGEVHFDVAPTPVGPWTTHDIVTVEARCADCNTYFASIVPFGATDETFTIAISNNHWNGDVIAHYRPSVLEVAIPS